MGAKNVTKMLKSAAQKTGNTELYKKAIEIEADVQKNIDSLSSATKKLNDNPEQFIKEVKSVAEAAPVEKAVVDSAPVATKKIEKVANKTVSTVVSEVKSSSLKESAQKLFSTMKSVASDIQYSDGWKEIADG